MRRVDKLPELLSPAGDFECLVAAVRGGADAVYVGGRAYGARAYAKNFDIDELCRAVSYCHLHGVKLYVTMNTLLEEDEICDAISFARRLYEIGVDALIVCDIGLISALRQCLPDFELHASTQMSIHNSYGADMAYNLGCSRVVLARELRGEDIRAVTERCLPEVEIFLHGALCVCHSGQCLFSSLVGGRSGNRGECAQPCRLPYGKDKYPLSLNDLSLAAHIRELIDMGVASLKIEGRMKSPSYVYTVTSIYRRLIDERRAATKDEEQRLAIAFSRGKFTDGYFTGRHREAMTGIRTDEQKRLSREAGEQSFAPDKVSVRAYARIKQGEPSQMTLYFKEDGRRQIDIGNVAEEGKRTARGAAAAAAISAPLTDDAVKARLCKMGNTFLSLADEDIELQLEPGVNLSAAEINSLRREAVRLFEEQWRRELPKEDKREADAGGDGNAHGFLGVDRTALFYDIEVLEQLSKRGDILDSFSRIFVPLHRLKDAGAYVTGVAMPPVIMESELDRVGQMLTYAAERGVRYALSGNLGHFPLVRSYGLIPVGDFRLNISNKNAARAAASLTGEDFILSAELTDKAARRIGGRVIAYGRIPLMITERCFMRENFGCERCSLCSFTDRRGVSFPIIREFEHRNLILNSAVTYMADKSNSLCRGGVCGMHLIFTTESAQQIEQIVRAFLRCEAMPLSVPFRRMGRRDFQKSK